MKEIRKLFLKEIFNEHEDKAISRPKNKASSESRESPSVPAKTKIPMKIKKNSKNGWRNSIHYRKRWIGRTMDEVIRL